MLPRFSYLSAVWGEQWERKSFIVYESLWIAALPVFWALGNFYAEPFVLHDIPEEEVAPDG